jgi:hypothetical protein
VMNKKRLCVHTQSVRAEAASSDANASPLLLLLKSQVWCESSLPSLVSCRAS